MQSDRQQTLNSYLKNIVADGSKPFRYRSGVRSLLGIPDSEGGDLALFPILPPSAFRYRHHPFMGEPYATHYSSYESGRSGSCSEQGGALEGKETETGIPHVSEKSRHDSVNRGIVRDRVLTGNATRQSAAMPESKQEEVLTEPTEKKEKPDVSVESARIEIPGTSERKTSFFSLSQKEGLTPLGKTENRAQKEMLQTDSGKNSVRESFSEAKEDAQTFNPASTKSSLEMLRRTKIIKEKPAIIPSPRVTKNEELEEVTTVTAEANSAEKNEFSRGIARHPAGDPEESGKFMPDQTPGASPSQNLGLAFANRSNRDAAGKIDQLRHAVHELTSKVSSQPARTDHGPKQQQPQKTIPSPAQQVIIIKKQSSRQATIPCAFWERSYLCHFHLRTLR